MTHATDLEMESIQPDHRVSIWRDTDNGDYLIDAYVKVEGGIKHFVYRSDDKPSLGQVLECAETFHYTSPRPYCPGQSCDGSISYPVMALFADYCATRGACPVELMLDAYPNEAGKWAVGDFIKSKEEAAWQGIQYPRKWNRGAVDGLVKSLHEINYHSLATVVADLVSDDNAAATVKDVLRGYGRNDNKALGGLCAIDDWQKIARQELERRATRIVQVLDEATLEVIAAGGLDFTALCREVATELSQAVAPPTA